MDPSPIGGRIVNDGVMGDDRENVIRGRSEFIVAYVNSGTAVAVHEVVGDCRRRHGARDSGGSSRDIKAIHAGFQSRPCGYRQNRSAVRSVENRKIDL